MRESLTPSKVEVKASQQDAILFLGTKGWTYKMIAEAIGCSESYVKLTMGATTDTFLPLPYAEGLSRLASDHGYDAYGERFLADDKCAMPMPSVEIDETWMDEVCDGTETLGHVRSDEKSGNYYSIDRRSDVLFEVAWRTKLQARKRMGLPVPERPRFDVPVNQLSIGFNGDGR